MPTYERKRQPNGYKTPGKDKKVVKKRNENSFDTWSDSKVFNLFIDLSTVLWAFGIFLNKNKWKLFCKTNSWISLLANIFLLFYSPHYFLPAVFRSLFLFVYQPKIFLKNFQNSLLSVCQYLLGIFVSLQIFTFIWVTSRLFLSCL